MRKILPVSILLAAMIALGTWTYMRIDTTSQELITYLKQIEDFVKVEAWDEARKSTDILVKEWNKAKGFWSYFLNHHEMDNIEVSIVRLTKLIKTENSLLIPSEIATLRLFIGHIPEKEAFALRNIL